MNHITKEILTECCGYNKGFYELSADSMGLSTKEFTEFIEKGKIGVDKFLPALAKRLTGIYEVHRNS